MIMPGASRVVEGTLPPCRWTVHAVQPFGCIEHIQQALGLVSGVRPGHLALPGRPTLAAASARADQDVSTMGFSGPRGPALGSVQDPLAFASPVGCSGSSVTATDLDFWSVTVDYGLAGFTHASNPGCASAGVMLFLWGNAFHPTGTSSRPLNEAVLHPDLDRRMTTGVVTGLTATGLHDVDHTPAHHGDAILQWRIP